MNAQEVIDLLVAALSNVMDAVSDMPSDPAECWPDEWAAARSALESAQAYSEEQK